MHDVKRASGDSAPAAPEPRERKPIRWFRVSSVVLVALLFPFVGSAAWGPAVCLLTLGALLWFNPPERSLSPQLNAVFLALLVLGAVPFLPAALFHMPEWRIQARQLGIALPMTLTPQPWMTLHSLLLLLAGLAWVYYVSVLRWTPEEHRAVLQLYLGGLLGLVLLADLFHLRGASLPFWRSERNFGPFQNRNNTANLLALGGLMMLACSYDEWKRSKVRAVLWSIAAVPVLAGLAYSYSRSGVVIFFLGTATWLGLMAARRRDKLRVGLATLALVALAWLFVARGGETFKRFGASRGLTGALVDDSRWPLQRDALALGSASSWCGLGMGNFADVFPQFRRESYNDKWAYHPDGDWVWLRVEMGWLSVGLVLAGCGLLARQMIPLNKGTNHRVRAAAAVAGVFFALHGLVDISGHSMGTLVPAVLLVGLAFNPVRELKPARWSAPLFQSLGLVFGIAGATFLLCVAQNRLLPGYLGRENAKAAARRLYYQKEFGRLFKVAAAGIRIAPLDWEFYNYRGAAIALTGGSVPQAQADFRRARFLFTNDWKLPFHQGLCFLQVNPAAAAEPWRDALRRAGADYQLVLKHMLDTTADRREFHAVMREIASDDPDRRIAFLERLHESDFAQELARIRATDPELSKIGEARRTAILAIWDRKGDRAHLVIEALRYPTWLKAAWPALARHNADQQRFQEAYELAHEHLPRPEMPTLDRRPFERLKREFLANRADFTTGYQFFRTQVDLGELKDALETIRTLTDQAEAPAYLHMARAELTASVMLWAEAWQSLQRYDPRLRPR